MTWPWEIMRTLVHRAHAVHGEWQIRIWHVEKAMLSGTGDPEVGMVARYGQLQNNYKNESFLDLMNKSLTFHRMWKLFHVIHSSNQELSFPDNYGMIYSNVWQKSTKIYEGTAALTLGTSKIKISSIQFNNTTGFQNVGQDWRALSGFCSF